MVWCVGSGVVWCGVLVVVWCVVLVVVLWCGVLVVVWCVSDGDGVCEVPTLGLIKSSNRRRLQIIT